MRIRINGESVSDSDIESMNRDKLRQLAKTMNISQRGSIKQLRGRIKDKFVLLGGVILGELNVSSGGFKGKIIF